MASPITLAKKFDGTIIQPPNYDWNTQTRDGGIVGRYTSGSIRTYNSKGQPADSRADQDD